MNQGVEESHRCATCAAEVRELRRGRCWTCYSRWSEQRPVGLGACCAVCEERRRENLRLVEVQGRSLPLCHVCAVKVSKLDLVPYSVEGLRAALRRDRRQVEDRREGAPDDRITTTDRRNADRRAASLRAAGIGELARDSAVWQLGDGPVDLDLDVELDVSEEDIVEATMVAESPLASAAAAPPPLPAFSRHDDAAAGEPSAPSAATFEAASAT